ncbi:HD domain-containing protein [Maridesulfovibrio salexigens]|uniref:Metal-dependent phosphohydrolase HD sub domain protein n=1 Tax=Maridesulfovibrio salexigens (strain ATCC 14822 / DSM 2638 / NCIMB 8403 / VKM B-1763) TaxID=526222 RepID=C6BTM8_MARSD|nr:HD domain-containing protein [Maridesulfovibrio salexigens]ACS79808.1 metal-dependent phosphohydrolase HD sub domain protein [Maridesulfovibrio salexigens DSM 2638]
MTHLKTVFSQFVSPFLLNANEKERPDIQLKIDHSFDVFENSLNICKSLSLPAELTETAQIAALYHDTGRFPQYSKYRTFKDSESCNHGTLGARTVLKYKLLNGLPNKQRNTILGAIALHNRSTLPSYISDELRICTEIVRDSDKIDIIKVLIPHLTNQESKNEVPLMGLKEKPDEITPAVLQAVKEGRQGAYQAMQCLNDFRLLLLSWAYDLNFEWSRKEMIKRGYVETLMSQLPDTDQIHALRNPIIEQLNS